MIVLVYVPKIVSLSLFFLKEKYIKIFTQMERHF